MKDAQRDLTARENGDQNSADAMPDAKMSRRMFLAVSGGLVAGVSVASLSGGLLSPARADILDTVNKLFNLDPVVLNFAHEMEELQADFFERALRSALFNDMTPRERDILVEVATQDRAHFDLLDMELKARHAKGGGAFVTPNMSATQRPRRFQFDRQAVRSRDGLFAQAVSLKEDAVSAYHGAVHLIHDGFLLTPAAAIAGVDGRHLAVLREISGLDPVPYSFENQISAQTIGKRLGRYGFRGGSQQDYHQN